MNTTKIINYKNISKPQNILNNILKTDKRINLSKFKIANESVNSIKTKGFTKTTVIPQREGVSFAEIFSFVQKHPEEAFRRVDKIVDGHHIMYEGATIDIDSMGRLLPKKTLTNKAPIDKKLLIAKSKDSKLFNHIV